MLKITAEEIHFILYQYLHESGKFPIQIFKLIYDLKYKRGANYSCNYGQGGSFQFLTY